MHKKYDLYVSLGRGCSATQVLRNLNLQFWSYPFDWVYGSNIVDRAKIIKNNFNKFLEKNDFKLVRTYLKNNWFQNTNIDITFPHDFPKKVSFENYFEKFKDKYTRRIKRLLKLIESSKRVCFLYIWTEGDYELYTDDDLIKAQQILQSRFPKVVIDLVYFEINNNSLKNKKILKINKNIVKYSFDYSLHDNKRPYAIRSVDVMACLKDYSISLRHLTFLNILQKYHLIIQYDEYINLREALKLILHKFILTYKIAKLTYL